MLCKHPFFRDPSGSIRWQKNTTPEERLACTPFPCGVCIPCRVNAARVWTCRIMLESMSCESSFFLTLTYSDENLPSPVPSVSKRHVQLWLKRFRKSFQPFRYFLVGEYGDKSNRPHYHLCLFTRRSSVDQVNSLLASTWHYGFVSVSGVGIQSARYIAGYTIKKMTKKSDTRLEGREPEFMLSSRKGGGIGALTIDRIAFRLLSSPHSTQVRDSVLRQLRIGGHNWPLGRYLTHRLFVALGQHSSILENEFWEYQQQFFEAYPVTDRRSLALAVSEDNAHDVFVKEQRYNLYHTRRSL